MTKNSPLRTVLPFAIFFVLVAALLVQLARVMPGGWSPSGGRITWAIR